ncbi:MAG: DUF429 domain-containing protein [Planctomycetaceae bacterium]|nr:DUF429 domain-containing protein [Planctomycetaceae bacterium]
MNRIGGVDGCKGGWLRVERTADDRLVAEVLTTERLLLDALQFAVLAIDIPIGLPDHGPRRVDEIARRTLRGPRASSVFPTPVRAALDGESYEQACALSYAACEKKLSRQAFAILPKIKEVDALLQGAPGLEGRIREVHPEICFYFLNGGRPMTHGKKTSEGKVERAELLAGHFGNRIHELRRSVASKLASIDDLWDALAALWSAERVLAGCNESLRDAPTHDSRGLPMEMVA